jgi:DMSO/TMAO reductase YedYZ molybdopterin-dependent catalytic subunit
VIRTAAESTPGVTVLPPVPFPNANSPVQPVPGTRPEYTPVAQHYRIDIDTEPPRIDGSSWRLPVHGLVDNPLNLTLSDLQMRYPPVQQFVTLSCISNPVAGPLTGSTMWTGARLKEVLSNARVRSEAKWVSFRSADGFHETMGINLVQSDERIILCYAWNGHALPPEHGYPLRVYIPDRYGMKQPKWIIEVELVADYMPGYWVAQDWDGEAIMRTTSVIDVIAVDHVELQAGRKVIPVGGIAHAGDRGISQVVVQLDNGPWEPAELRAPVSGLTQVIWRYEMPFSAGYHSLTVHCRDGNGDWQEIAPRDPFPSGATGLHTKTAHVAGPDNVW